MSTLGPVTQIKRWIPNSIKAAVKWPFVFIDQQYQLAQRHYQAWQTRQQYLDEQVRYVAQRPKEYLAWGDFVASDLAGKPILMIGPGHDLYSSMVFAGHGAQVYIAEKYPIVWDEQFHPKFYRRLRRLLRHDFPTANLTSLQTVIASGQHDTIPKIEMLLCGLEEISALADNSIDISLSNAVFEHLYDAERAIQELFRVTRPGGTGYHQIDFRWHRDFDNPLEYCTLTEEVFLDIAADCNYECGNRLRYPEFQTFFEQAGFVVDNFEGNIFSESGYVEAVRPRLQPHYRNMPFDALHTLSGLFVVRKPA